MLASAVTKTECYPLHHDVVWDYGKREMPHSSLSDFTRGARLRYFSNRDLLQGGAILTLKGKDLIQGRAVLFNSLPPRAYLTKRLPHAERFREWAAKRKNYFFKKITADRVFKIKSSFLAPFFVNGWILSCNHQKWKIMTFSYLNIELY